MIFSDSPVKNIAEKLNPLSQRNKISKLKFERKKDYKTFLDFIKKNTKELEQRDDIIEKTKKVGLVAGGLGIAALLFGSVKGRKESDDLDNLRKNMIPKALMRAKREREREERRGKGSDISAFQKIPNISSLLSKLFQKSGGALTRTSTSNVKSKQRVKESVINQEIVNQNKRKRLFSRQKQLTAAGGVDSKNQKLLPDRAKSLTDAKRFAVEQRAKSSPNQTLSNKDLARVLGIDESKLEKTSKIGAEIEQSKLSKGGIFKGVRSRFRQLSLNFSNVTDNITNIIGGRNQEQIMGNILRDIEGDPNTKKIRAAIEGETGTRTREFTQTDKTITKGNEGKQLEIDFKKKQELTREMNRKDMLRRMFNLDDGDMGNPFMQKSQPQETPKKLTKFERFNRFSNRVLNSPAAKFTTFLGGLFASPKVEIIKQLLTPTQLGPTDKEERRLIEESLGISNKPVNIFLNNGQSMLPFNQDLKLNNNINPPTDFQTPSNNIFIDPKQSLNIDDLFFLKSFTGG